MNRGLTNDVVYTRVARAIDGENLFGYRANEELAGRETFWGAFSLAVGHRRLTREEVAVLDDLVAANLVADPRIHPPKLGRLVASYGGTYAGVAAALLVLDRSLIGMAAAEHPAKILLAVSKALGDLEPTDEAVERAFDATPFTSGMLPGFGVPFRKTDERMPPMYAALEAHGRAHLHFVRVFDALARVLARRRGLVPNSAGLAAAMLLDLGFTPEHISRLGYVIAACALMGNAAEGAEQQLPLLQSLPLEHLEYVGSPPRRTRRGSRASQAGPGTGSAG